MARILVLSVAMLAWPCLTSSQVDSSQARILQEQRFNVGGGRFGSAFAQEDGQVFREESKGNNERLGQYSYIDSTGKKITVKYSAGVNGFRILAGDHIPSGGQRAAQAPLVEEQEYDYQYYEDFEPQSTFVNPHDPSHQQVDLLNGDLAGHLARRVFAPHSGTPAPRKDRVASAGQITLDRFPKGFNFIFRAQK